MFFSIIIPVYNAGRTLDRCVSSLLAQRFDDFEVLLIDDGSKDKSYAICERYADRDARFKLIHQENQGPSAARNEGLRRAKGEYLCFVDSDDFVVSDYLCRLYEEIEKTHAEALFFGYNKVDQKGRILGSYLPPAEASGTAMLAALSEQDMFGYTWIKCLSRECVGACLFPEDMSLFEDEVFVCEVLKGTDKVAVIQEALYCYAVDGANMLTGRTYENYCELSDRVFSAWEQLMNKVPGKEAFLLHKANTFVGRCRYYGLERDVNVVLFFKSLAKTRFFQSHTNWTALDRAIEKENWSAVKASVTFYQMKNKVAHMSRVLK